jgi:enoyl-CoA hydratase/carnithine racemase
MSENQYILLEKRDKIAYITFNRPEKLNAIRWQDYILLYDHFKDCEEDKNIRAIILTGRGRAFSAGDDLEGYPGSGQESVIMGNPGIALAMEGKYLELELSGYQDYLQRTCMLIMNSGIVSIAAVNGVCWAPEILYAMDFVIAADVARIAQGDVRNGICPGGGSTQLLPRLLGRRRAIEFILSSTEISAEEAYRMGLVNKVVPLADLMTEAEALARHMIERPYHAIKLVKMAVTKAQELPLRDGLALEGWYSGISIQSDYFRTFYKKFMDRKKQK